MKRQAIFRADASVEIGGGHISRCIALADRLHANGWHCILVTTKETLVVFPHLNRSKHSVIFKEKHTQLPCKDIRPTDILVIDHYEIDIKFESVYRDAFRSIIVIDDLADKPHDCDLLVDQGPGRLTKDYRGIVPSHARVLTGPNYALLSPRLASIRKKVLEQRQKTPQVPRILVMPGLTDPLCISPKVLAIVHDICPEGDVDIVLSDEAPSIADLKKMIFDYIPSASLHTNQSDLTHLLSSASICIGACGVSALERCCLGLPSLVLTTAFNQEAMAQTLHFKGAIEFIGCAKSSFENKLAESLTQLLESPDKQLSMSKIAATICDGKGADRVAKAIELL